MRLSFFLPHSHPHSSGGGGGLGFSSSGISYLTSLPSSSQLSLYGHGTGTIIPSSLTRHFSPSISISSPSLIIAIGPPSLTSIPITHIPNITPPSFTISLRRIITLISTHPIPFFYLSNPPKSQCHFFYFARHDQALHWARDFSYAAGSISSPLTRQSL